MTIETVPLTLPPSADPSKFLNFGREVIGIDPGDLSSSDFAEIRQLLYEVRYPCSALPRADRNLSTLEHSLILFSSSTTLFSSEM
jgi:hypothetical protein